MVKSMQGNDPVAIPEQYYSKAARQTGQITGIEPEIYQQGTEQEDSVSLYKKEVLSSGEAYYIRNGWSIDMVTFQEPCIPASLYEEHFNSWKKQQDLMKACADFYNELGFEKYQELVKENFLEQMKKMETLGIEIEKISVSESYRIVSKNRPESWQVEIAVQTGREGRGKLMIMANGNQLRLDGSVGAIGEIEELSALLYISADPVGFYFDHN